MTDFVRRLVSGNKARFKDGDLDVELGTSHSYLDAHKVILKFGFLGINNY